MRKHIVDNKTSHGRGVESPKAKIPVNTFACVARHLLYHRTWGNKDMLQNIKCKLQSIIVMRIKNQMDLENYRYNSLG